MLDDLLNHLATLKDYADHAQAVAAKYSFENVAGRWRDFITAEAARGV